MGGIVSIFKCTACIEARDEVDLGCISDVLTGNLMLYPYVHYYKCELDSIGRVNPVA